MKRIQKTILIFALLLLVFGTGNQTIMGNSMLEEKTQLIILADMGNEPDEEQQMVHMLTCCNEFELKGLIAITGKYMKTDPKPELFLKLIDGYEKVLPNLKNHARGWPNPGYLRDITKAGQENYGMEDVGKGKSSPGSELIKKVLLENNPKPVWIVVNAGSNTLAQALFDLRKQENAKVVNKVISKIRVFENGAQDDAGAWICSNFPGIHWIRSNYQTYAYGGPGGVEDGAVNEKLGPYYWSPYENSAEGQNEWLKEHVMENHGALGKLYPERYWDKWGYGFMEGGGTIPWMGLVNKGLFDIDHPRWGGWSGRFSKKKEACFWSRHPDVKPNEKEHAPFYTYVEVSDTWTDPKTGLTYHSDYVPVWRWRQAMYNDQMARMDWCVKKYQDANHHPVAGINGDTSNTILKWNVIPGEKILLDASSSSDPDMDSLRFRWWVYQEAGTYPGTINIDKNREAEASLHLPTGAGSHEIHVVLEVTDTNPVIELYDYRRIILQVKPYQIKRSP